MAVGIAGTNAVNFSIFDDHVVGLDVDDARDMLIAVGAWCGDDKVAIDGGESLAGRYSGIGCVWKTAQMGIWYTVQRLGRRSRTAAIISTSAGIATGTAARASTR